MEQSPPKKILVAMDGSVYSGNALRYLSQLFTDLPGIQFHLLSIVPCAAMPAGREWMDELTMLTALSPEARKRYSTLRRYLNEAVMQLGRRGIAPEQITADLRLSRQSIAKDILHEAKKGLYDALVIGRRGLSRIEEMFMGSVSSFILEKCHDTPVWIVDGQVQSRKFLVPVDGSVNSLLAVDHLAHIVSGNPHAEVTLFHSSALFASRPKTRLEDFFPIWGEDWCRQFLTGPDSLFEAPRQILTAAGLPEERIKWLHASKGIEPSRQIIRQALVDDFGTIVLGRRGNATKKGIFKGVSDRVVFMAEHVAIWIVG